MKTFTLLLWLIAAAAMLPAEAQAQASKASRPATAAKPAAKPTTTKPTATTKPATAAKPAAPARPAPAAVSAAESKPAEQMALVTDKMETPKPATDALKVKAETNPVTKRLTVRTNNAGPVRVEINDDEGRPVLTKDMIVGNQDAVLDVSRLPAGYYIVNCTTGERRGMRRVMIGQ